MELKNYQIAKELLKGLDHDFNCPKPESLVSAAEDALGLKFPPSYRQFLLDFGCGSIEDFEVYGIVNDDFKNSGIPDGIWLTHQDRNDYNLDKKYILIGDLGDGAQYALDTSITDNNGENPVMLISPEYATELIAPDFGTYFLEGIKRVMEYE